MNIAIIAHNDRKLLLEQFCKAHETILNQHTLIATDATAKFIERALDHPVTHCMRGASGGKQQIASLISYDEIDLLLLFRSTVQSTAPSPEDASILRLCDSHCIPVATNLATAEILLSGLQHGDLDWRDLHHAAEKKK